MRLGDFFQWLVIQSADIKVSTFEGLDVKVANNARPWCQFGGVSSSYTSVPLQDVVVFACMLQDFQRLDLGSRTLCDMNGLSHVRHGLPGGNYSNWKIYIVYTGWATQNEMYWTETPTCQQGRPSLRFSPHLGNFEWPNLPEKPTPGQWRQQGLGMRFG